MSQKTSQVCKVIHMSELHCSLESNVRANVRDAADTYKMRPKCKGSPAEPRAWGGINILFFVDFWQLPPVRQTAIFHNPFEVAKPDHRVNRIMRNRCYEHDRGAHPGQKAERRRLVLQVHSRMSSRSPIRGDVQFHTRFSYYKNWKLDAQ